MKVLCGDSTGELELSGTRSELLGLARRLRSGWGGIRLDSVSDPAPYSRCLSRIDIRATGGKVVVSSPGDSSVLSIRGGSAAVELLALNLDAFALDSGPGDHLHVDYFPGHDFLAGGSLVVVCLG